MNYLGNKRPCQRCIERDLGEACQDGMGRKAKYLYVTPLEVSGPVLDGPSRTSTFDSITSPEISGGFCQQPNSSPPYTIFTANPQNQMQGRLSYSSEQQRSLKCLQESHQNPWQGELPLSRRLRQTPTITPPPTGAAA